MVDGLIAMRLAVLRHSLHGTRAGATQLGLLAGLGLAVCTILAGAGLWSDGAGTGTLLAQAGFFWAVGWAAAPLIGGGEPLRPEVFAMLPVRRIRLATGLLAVGFVGIGPVVTLVALCSLLPYAATLGPTALLVALPTVVLELAFVVMLLRVVNGVIGAVLRTLPGAALVGILWGLISVLPSWGWPLIPLLGSWGRDDVGATLVRALPSGWPVLAVEAAARGEVGTAVGLLAALAALVAVMLLAWSALLARRLTAGATTPRPAQAGPLTWASALFDDAASPTAAVAAKELRNWSRDPLRHTYLWFGVTYGLVACLLPLAVGWWGMVPFAGMGVLLLGSAIAANPYGTDGTAHWLTLLTPGGSAADVRGRQIAWLLVFGGLTTVITCVCLPLAAANGQSWAWPWVLALLASGVGGGAGLVSLLSVWSPVALTDPHKRGANPTDSGDQSGGSVGVVYLMLMLLLLAWTPTIAVLVLGTVLGAPALTWAAVLVGCVTGLWLAWWGGRAAARRLDAVGPELLQYLRTGVKAARPAPTPARATRSRAEQEAAARRRALLTGEHLTPGRRVVWAGAWVLTPLALFPQGLVALAFALSGTRNHSWFLATYLGGWSVPTAIGILLLGLVTGWVALTLPIWASAADTRGTAAIGAEEPPVLRPPTG